eukprot:PhF_6_TR11186/c0_g1_i2/m.18027
MSSAAATSQSRYRSPPASKSNTTRTKVSALPISNNPSHLDGSPTGVQNISSIARSTTPSGISTARHDKAWWSGSKHLSRSRQLEESKILMMRERVVSKKVSATHVPRCAYESPLFTSYVSSHPSNRLNPEGLRNGIDIVDVSVGGEASVEGPATVYVSPGQRVRISSEEREREPQSENSAAAAAPQQPSWDDRNDSWVRFSLPTDLQAPGTHRRTLSPEDPRAYHQHSSVRITRAIPPPNLETDVRKPRKHNL